MIIPSDVIEDCYEGKLFTEEDVCEAYGEIDLDIGFADFKQEFFNKITLKKGKGKIYFFTIKY